MEGRSSGIRDLAVSTVHAKGQHFPPPPPHHFRKHRLHLACDSPGGLLSCTSSCIFYPVSLPISGEGRISRRHFGSLIPPPLIKNCAGSPVYLACMCVLGRGYRGPSEHPEMNPRKTGKATSLTSQSVFQNMSGTAHF